MKIYTLVTIIVLLFTKFVYAQVESDHHVLAIGVERTQMVMGYEEKVENAILSLRNRFSYCYERELHYNTGLYGELFVYFNVREDGAMENIVSEATNSSFNSNSMFQCISKAISSIRAPKIIQNIVFRARLRFKNNISSFIEGNNSCQ